MLIACGRRASISLPLGAILSNMCSMQSTSRLSVGVCSGISSHDGGVFFAVRSLCEELGKRSVKLNVFGATHRGSADDNMMWGAVSVTPYKAYGPLGISLDLRSKLAHCDAQLIHQHGIWLYNQWASWQWQKRTKRPVIVSPHGMLDPWALRRSVWKKKVAGWLFADEALRQATCIHALCRSEAESVRAYGLNNPIAIIPNGVELPLFDSSNSKPQTSNRKKQLLFLGRIHPKKGIRELIEAWAKAQSQKAKTLSDWQLLIAGWDDGGFEPEIRKLAGALELGDSIEFVGPKYGKEKEQLLRGVDAFVLPSFSEGLPVAVLEAWSYGLPVVMTDFCNLSEGFSVDAAIRVEPNAESILNGLKALSAMTFEARRAMGMRGRALIEGSFAWPRIASDMHRVYEWCLTGQNPPECMEFDGDDD